MAQVKHIGRVIDTGKRVLVAYRTIPNDPFSCLVIATESLDDSMHNALISLVESPAGQAAYEFAEVLDRSIFPDGSRMLPSLHVKGRLIKAPTSSIEMTPAPGVTISLSELNLLIAESRGVPLEELCIKPNQTDDAKESKASKVDTSKEGLPAEPVKSSMTTEEKLEFFMTETKRLAERAEFYAQEVGRLHRELTSMSSPIKKARTKKPKTSEKLTKSEVISG